MYGEDHPNYKSLFHSLGNLYLASEDYNKALEYYQKVLDYYFVKYGKRNKNYANALINLELVSLNQGEFRKAEEYLLEALDIRKEVYGVNHNEYAEMQVRLGSLYYEMGDYQKAEEYYQTALKIIREYLGSKNDSYARSLTNLGLFHKNIGNYKKSEEYYLKSSSIQKEMYGEDHINYASNLINLEGLYLKLGDIKKSEELLLKAEVIYMKKYSESSSHIARIWNNLGYFYNHTENLKMAEFYNKKALNAYLDLYGENSRHYATGCNNLGYLLFKQNKLSDAEYYLQKSTKLRREILPKYHPHLALSIFNLGLVAYARKDFIHSINLFNESHSIREKILNEKDLDLKLNMLYIAKVGINLCDYKMAKFNFFKLFHNNSSELSSNFSWLSAQQKHSYWQQEKDFYDNMNSFSVSAVDSVPSSTELSYNANLISKSLLLETSRELDQAVSQSTDEEMKAQFAEMKQLRKLYSKMQSEGSTNKEIMERYKTQADSLDKILVNKLGEYAASKRKFEITWKDVQSNLSTSDAAIEFARYYDDKDSLYKYMALVVRPDYEFPKLVNLGEEDAIRTAAQNKDFSILYNEAWKGIDSLLVGVKNVYYSPAGELNNVSFSALCTEEGKELVASNKDKIRGVVIGNNKTTTKACNAVLMDKYELHQLTTTRYLADGTLKKEKPMQPSLALVGGINFDDIPEKNMVADKEQSNEDFAFHANLNKRTASTNGKKRGKRSSSNYGKKMDLLPGTKEEVVNIAGLLNTSNWKVQTKSDKKAGEYEFKKELETKAPGVLHIATHGFAFPDEAKQETKLMDMSQTSTYKVSEDPMVRCGLMLGGSNISWTGNPQKMIEQTGDDGILTAAEVANLDLSNTKLVVLSACETGLGKIEGSEGTFGLKRGFKLAGVEQMIVSLWSVPDKETMELMTLFYSDLTKTLNPVTSFEKAQKEMRAKYPTDPEKWAGFVLVR